jgi:plastocyanin
MKSNRFLSGAAPLAGAILLLVSLAGCGSKYSSPTGPSNPAGSTTITATASGVSPQSMTVGMGAAVTFANQDSVTHQFASTQCPELNTPVLQPGGRSTATMANSPESCAFSDRLNPSNAAFQGSITVSSTGPY